MADQVLNKMSRSPIEPKQSKIDALNETIKEGWSVANARGKAKISDREWRWMRLHYPAFKDLDAKIQFTVRDRLDRLKAFGEGKDKVCEDFIRANTKQRKNLPKV